MEAKAHYMNGLQKIGSGDFDGAIDAFGQALAADSSFYMAHLGWSQALDRLGNVDAAVEQAQKAIEIAPDEPLAHTSLSRLFQQKGMILEAESEMALAQQLQDRT